MATWWERYPGLLEAEQEALDRAGYSWKIDENARHAGQLVIHLENVPSNGDVWNFRAEFPATYPYFPPTVILDDVTLPRHHHPLGKNLCLLARHGEEWQPQRDSLAKLISEQFPKILATAGESSSTLESASEQEDHIGEPLSSFLDYAENSVIIVPDDVPDRACANGRLVVQAKPLAPPNRGGLDIHGLVSGILDRERKPLVVLTATLPSHTSRRDGYWMRLGKRPPHENTETFRRRLLDTMVATIPAFRLDLMNAPVGRTLIAGFLYEDETSWQRKDHDWVFLHVAVQAKAKNRNQLPNVVMTCVRADKGGETSWMQRAPMLMPLRGKKALLFGVGSLGSPVALHLARAGLEKLTIMDEDFLQVGNTVRWALGWQYAGQRKVDALCSYISENHPYTQVDGAKFILGLPYFDLPGSASPNSDYDLLRERISAVDIVIDAAANFRVSHFLSDLAVELGKPYVWLTTTHGCAGGIVGRRIPGSGNGCWHCHNLRLGDQSLPMPPEAGTGSIQPGGCSQATFIGAGIDSEEIALMASRLAVATLCRDAEGYGDFGWNVGVCEIYRDGHPIAPEWHTSVLPAHPNCHVCGKK